ncbi:MAG: alpha-glucuronidase [Tannerellaceae bacterium]|jgi:alpha-glucuronidase|nr:alpha-glucuronidase [Tannerellaceae bacterium]
MKKKLLFVFILLFPFFLKAEDGSRLWLRAGQDASATVVANKQSPLIATAMEELQHQWRGGKVHLTLRSEKALRNLLGKDGFRITGHTAKEVHIQASGETGLLYGAYHLLRLQETRQLPDELNITESPAYDLRLLNHWDNLNGTIERGYAGHSLWKWEELPHTLSPRYKQYARANASIGINGAVLNNVNASPDILRTEYLGKVKAIAEVFRPYGMKVYLSVNFASPKVIGGLPDADPSNPEVQTWWKHKVKEIYALIPDFGGFLVKANSEGQPGPQDYGRSHAEGANMLAGALKPFGGVVMWRAFVYAPDSDDRAKQAYAEFIPFDGRFRENVIIQIKNGPVDFQPREPFNPLFGALQSTPSMIEFQVTQEYLGQSNHLVYLAPLFKETLDSDTYIKGEGSTVAKITGGALYPQMLSAIAGVANIGEDTNWCGHHFAQANWYAFGRLAWDYRLSSEEIAEEWLKMTFTTDARFIVPVRDMMIESREAVVNYMMPLGLHHLFAEGHHYGPAPWYDAPGRPDWRSVYYHQATPEAIGFDRTTNGSDAVSQYNSPLKERYNDIETCPEVFLLWFHRVPWDYRMKSGKTFWDELCYAYDAGVTQVRNFQKLWDRMEPYVDTSRFKEVQSKLKIQARDAVWWKDACLLYFQSFSQRPIPYEIERPVYELEDLKKIKLDMKHHN